MSLVSKKLREARRVEIKIGEITFFGHRVTPDQFDRYRSNSTPITDGDICRLHIDGADGIKESDCIDGGAKTPWKFNSDDFAEIIVEKPEWYKTLAAELLKDAREKHEARAENKKN